MSPETYYSIDEAADLFRRALAEAITDRAMDGPGFCTPETARAFVTTSIQNVLHTCADVQREIDNGA